MNALDNLKNKAHEVSGKVKQRVGRAIGDQDLEAKGKPVDIKADLK